MKKGVQGYICCFTVTYRAR